MGIGTDGAGSGEGTPSDPAAAAERLRRWLDDLTVAWAEEVERGSGVGEALAAWQRAHAGGVISAALALEQIAAGEEVAAEGGDGRDPT